MKETVDEVILELEGIVWEAENADFFSISDLPPLIDSLKGIDWKGGGTEQSWCQGLLAWVAIPFFVILLPFAWLFSFFFQRR